MALRSVVDHRACPAELRNQVGETSLALVDKCLAGRSTTKEKAIQALLLFIQIGAVEPVLVCSPLHFFTRPFVWHSLTKAMWYPAQNQLLKGCQNKVAKVAASCLFCVKEAIRCSTRTRFD